MTEAEASGATVADDETEPPPRGAAGPEAETAACACTPPFEPTAAETAVFGAARSTCTVAAGDVCAETEAEATGVETVAAIGVFDGAAGTVAETDTGGR